MWIERLIPQRVGPGRFFVSGVLLFALKFLIDRSVTSLVFGRPWSIFNYLIPNEAYTLLALPPRDRPFYLTMLAIAIPFVWIGIALTSRRLRDAGLSPWLAPMFFIPAGNLIFFAVLSVVPSKRELAEAQPVMPATGASPAQILAYGTDAHIHRPLEEFFPQNSAASAALAILVPIPISIGLLLLGVHGLGNYGWGIFVALPFLIGMIAPIIHGYRTPRTLGQSMAIATAALVASGGAIIGFAIEGLGCLMMLIPLAVPFVWIGAIFGHAIQRSEQTQTWRTLGIALLCMPMLLAAEAADRPPPEVFAVATTLDVDAPPQVVWQNVISFSEIPPPREWLFSTGIAYPVRARIDGAGVGAIRYCEFSTGAFVEPIEIWDAPRVLKFAVTENPPPMREWSPFNVHPPHLKNFLVSHGGQFRLTELPGGRTRLEGTTWYEHRMWPQTYWRWWSDFIIHRIHLRVLNHVAQISTLPAP